MKHGGGGGFSFLITFAVLIALWLVIKLVNSIWLRPMKVKHMFNKQGIRGPQFKPIFGNTLEMLRVNKEAGSKPMDLSHDVAPRVLAYFHQVATEYGRISLTWFGSTAQLLVTEPDMIKDILSERSGIFQKVPLGPLLKPFARGLANLDGETWATHRKIINPAFYQDKLKEMIHAVRCSCDELVNRWEDRIPAHGDKCCEVEIMEEMMRLSADIISRTAFGSNYEEGKVIFELQKEQTKLLIQVAQRIYIPGSRFLRTKTIRRIQELKREIESVLSKIITKREAEMKLGRARHDDLLGLMIESNQNQEFERKMTREEIIDECRFFYLAGEETTATLLTWTMILLSMHTEWQDSARDEVMQVCGKTTPTVDHLHRLKTVTMILYEALRLYPPAIMLSRHTAKTVKVGNITLPEGTRLMLATLMLHHDPQIWGEDASKFNPNRFSAGIMMASKHPLGFLPFGYGPRICVGQMFALMEAKTALAVILPCFSFKLSPSYVHAPYPVLTVQPQHGAPIILSRIKSSS